MRKYGSCLLSYRTNCPSSRYLRMKQEADKNVWTPRKSYIMLSTGWHSWSLDLAAEDLQTQRIYSSFDHLKILWWISFVVRASRDLQRTCIFSEGSAGLTKSTSLKCTKMEPVSCWLRSTRSRESNGPNTFAHQQVEMEQTVFSDEKCFSLTARSISDTTERTKNQRTILFPSPNRCCRVSRMGYTFLVLEPWCSSHRSHNEY